MMVWVFLITVWLSGGPMVVHYGPYPNWVMCYREMARVTADVGRVTPNYDLRKCFAIATEKLGDLP